MINMKKTLNYQSSVEFTFKVHIDLQSLCTSNLLFAIIIISVLSQLYAELLKPFKSDWTRRSKA